MKPLKKQFESTLSLKDYVIILIIVFVPWFIALAIAKDKSEELHTQRVCDHLEANLWLADDNGQPNNEYSKIDLAMQNAECK